MSIDMNITDTCLKFVNAAPQYWLNTSLIMTNTSDTGLAVVGANTTKVTVTCRTAQGEIATDCQDLTTGERRALFEVWISGLAVNLALNKVEPLPGDGTGQPVVGVGGAGIISTAVTDTTVNWTSQSTDSTKLHYVDPANAPANHRCLVARCYTNPDNQRDGTNSALADHTLDDPHYAQHNLTVQPVAGGHMVKMKILTGNPREEPELVVLQAVPDLQLARGTLDAILPSLKTIPGFKQISDKPLRRVSFDLDPLTEKDGGGVFDKIEDFFEDKTKDVLRDLEGLFHKAAPGDSGVHSRVKIGGDFAAQFDFIADTHDAQPGNAYIYHLTQTRAQGQPNGGLTVAFVVV
jgi:hypothetical protein